ncbi:MAG: DUF4340 domain-containing protein [bacterium]|nr:DUF4340 domain-containing protein [bacterium]
MSNKTLIIIFGALAVILILLLMRDRRIERPDDVFLLVDTTKISEISIKQGTTTTLLKKEGGEWRMKQPVDWPVQAWAMTNMLNSIDTLEVEYIVTEDPTKYKDFEVDDEKGALITINTGKEKVEFVVGSLGATWRHTHMRKPGDKNVYLVKGSIRSYLVKRPDDWRDRRIFNIPDDSLLAVTAKFDKGGWTLAKDDTTWMVDIGNKKIMPDDNVRTGVISGLVRLNIGDFPPDSVVRIASFAEPLVTFNFTLKDNSSHSVVFAKHPSNDQQVLFKVDNRPDIFGQWKGSFDMLNKKGEEWKTPPAPKAPKGAPGKAGTPPKKGAKKDDHKGHDHG